MKKIIQFNLWIGFAIVFFPSCEQWDLDQVDFISVELTDLEPLSINAVQLSGEIKDLRIGQVSEHGFIWTTQSTLPTFLENEGVHYLGRKDVADLAAFFAEIEDLVPDTRYNFRAFATMEGTITYSESIVWETGTGMVFTDSIAYIGGRSLEVFGSISDLDAGLVAVSHGFCWSTQNELPDLSDDFKDLGLQDSNRAFSDTLSNLEHLISVHFRAFAILRHPITFELDTLYGQLLSFDGNLSQFWTQRVGFGGEIRDYATGFSINSKGYLGTGLTDGGAFLNDFWEYDPQMDSWTQRADFGGDGRWDAVGFSIDDKGYLGTGVNTFGQDSKDFWEYNSQTNTWTQRADLSGEGRSGAVGFSINGKGYIGLGISFEGYLSDFWEYNPQTDSWTQRANFEGGGRFKAVGFSINDQGYVGTGWDGSVRLSDFWEYDPQANTWIQRADFGGDGRSDAVGFSINDQGYVGTGWVASGVRLSDFWEYDPHANTWIQRADFGGDGRSDAVGFSINGKGYIGIGNAFLAEFSDFWEYDTE